jgi:hypothetical protein
VDRPADLAAADTTADPVTRRWVHHLAPDLPVPLVITLREHSAWARVYADHGKPSDADAHVPLVLWGPGIRPGRYDGRAATVDIAPTLARVLGRVPDTMLDGRVLGEARGGARRTRSSIVCRSGSRRSAVPAHRRAREAPGGGLDGSRAAPMADRNSRRSAGCHSRQRALDRLGTLGDMAGSMSVLAGRSIGIALKVRGLTEGVQSLEFELAAALAKTLARVDAARARPPAPDVPPTT